MGPRVGRGGAASGAGKARAATVVPDAAAGSPSSKTRGHRALSDVLCASLWADFSAGVGHSALAHTHECRAHKSHAEIFREHMPHDAEPDMESLMHQHTACDS